MRTICIFLVGTALTACAVMPEQKTLTIVNAAGLNTAMLAEIRTFAQKELRVPVRLTEEKQLGEIQNTELLEQAALSAKHENDVAYIVVAELDNNEHLQVDADRGIAVINAKALYTADAVLFTGRIRRMVMRAAAFTLGIDPTPDPFCVTRDYRSLEDLDRMGNNFSPPWQARFAKEAAKRGLHALNSAAGNPSGVPGGQRGIQVDVHSSDCR